LRPPPLINLLMNADFGEMKRRLEDVFLPSAAIVMLYEMGLAVGERSARQLIDQTGVEALGDVLEAISKTKRAEGWGKICFKDLAMERGEVKGRIIVEGLRKINNPSLPLFKGLLGRVSINNTRSKSGAPRDEMLGKRRRPLRVPSEPERAEHLLNSVI